jgi:hypothetical protein
MCAEDPLPGRTTSGRTRPLHSAAINRLDGARNDQTLIINRHDTPPSADRSAAFCASVTGPRASAIRFASAASVSDSTERRLSSASRIDSSSDTRRRNAPFIGLMTGRARLTLRRRESTLPYPRLSSSRSLKRRWSPTGSRLSNTTSGTGAVAEACPFLMCKTISVKRRHA